MSSLQNFQKKYDRQFFQSCCVETPEFKSFCASLKRALNRDLKESALELDTFSKGHFYASGFLKGHGGYVYFCVDEVRPYADLRRKVYCRIAEHNKDFHGRENHMCELSELLNVAEWLLKQDAARKTVA